MGLKQRDHKQSYQGGISPLVEGKHLGKIPSGSGTEKQNLPVSMERAVKATHLNTNSLCNNGPTFYGMEVVESSKNAGWDLKACTL